MEEAPDLRKWLKDWPYDPNANVRFGQATDGRLMILVRHPMGLDHYEADGCPEGEKPDGMESLFHGYLARAESSEGGGMNSYSLPARACSELYAEGVRYHERFILLSRLKDWQRAERDALRNLRLVEFVFCYAEAEEARAPFQDWKGNLSNLHVIVRALRLISEGLHSAAVRLCCSGMEDFEGSGLGIRELFAHLHARLLESPLLQFSRPATSEAAFISRGDYWMIAYRGQTAHVRASRGLQLLALLLRHPGQEFHVSELGSGLTLSGKNSGTRNLFSPRAEGEILTERHDAPWPMIDERAKGDYRRRLEDLREELEEAERFNDQIRVAMAEAELFTLSQHLASAVGLGGRDRATGSQSERARSAVTKRIKDSIQKLSHTIPSLGDHLHSSIKTGYFCCYKPPSTQSASWKFI